MIPSLRLFFALWPHPAERAQFAELGKKLKRKTGGRLVAADLLHITLVFLGETKEEHLTQLLQSAGEICCDPFTLKIDQIACWKNGIAWAGTSHIPEALLTMQQQLVQSVTQLGYHLERRNFVPHLTLLRKAPRPSLLESIAPINWTIDSFALVHSKLGSAGPVYTILRSWPLTGNRLVLGQ